MSTFLPPDDPSDYSSSNGWQSLWPDQSLSQEPDTYPEQPVAQNSIPLPPPPVFTHHPQFGAASQPSEPTRAQSAEATAIASYPRSRNRRVGAFAASALLVASLAGGAAGYGAARLNGDPNVASSSSSAGVIPVSFTTSNFSAAEVLQQIEPAVVTITTQITQQRGRYTATGEAAGTGIILTSDGQVLTNAHVIEGATSISVMISGDTTARTATVIGSDTEADVALLQVEGASNMPTATLSTSTTPVVGEDVIAVGNALALEGGFTVSKGIVSATGRAIDTDSSSLTNLIQTDAAISSGDSGGPLVDSAGDVIGMNTAGASSSSAAAVENIGFAIPISDAMKVVDQIRDGRL